MQGRITSLELKDFKSYEGSTVIPFLHNFAAVVGPNGAGKSNLMDAFVFCLGVSEPRTANIKDLVYRGNSEASQGKKKSAHVELSFERGEDDILRFKRVILVSAAGAARSEYRLDGSKVSKEAYQSALEEINILAEARNFLVFQGDVTSLGGGNPKALTRLFEQISGSQQLKEEYEQLKEERDKAEEVSMVNFQKRRGIAADRKQFKEQKDEADRYRSLLRQKSQLAKEQMVFEVFHIEREFNEAISAIEQSQLEAEDATKKLSVAERGLISKQKEKARTRKDRILTERKFKEQHQAAFQLNPEVIATREAIKHQGRRLAQTMSQMDGLERERDAQAREQVALEEQLFAIQEAARELEERLEEEERASGTVVLSEEQRSTYNALKEQCAREAHQELASLRQLRTQHLLCEEELGSLLAREASLREKNARLAGDERNLASRLAELEALHEELQQAERDGAARLKELQKSNRSAAKRRDELAEQLQETQEQLRELRLEHSQSMREQKAAESLAALKRLYPGVRGRLVDLCQPRQAKYQTAATVALGRHMESIVVNDKRTAIECITYLREQRAGNATFLPLDSLHPKPVQERLRQLDGGIKLAIDVLSFDSSLERAMLYALGSTIICSDMETAKRIAYGPTRVKAVTLDGSVVYKSGLMAGGASSASRSDHKWSEKRVVTLKSKRDQLLRDMDASAVTLQSLTAEQNEQVALDACKGRIGGAKLDVQMMREKLKEAKSEAQMIGNELERVGDLLREQQRQEADLSRQVQEAQDALGAVEKGIFADFCRQLRVPSIRAYEQQSMKRSLQVQEKRAFLAQQSARLENAIEYAKTREHQEMIDQLQSDITASRKELTQLQKKQKKLAKEEQKVQKVMATYREMFAEKKAAEAKLDEEEKELKRAVANAISERDAATKAVTEREGHKVLLQSRRHAVLRRAQIEEIELPFAGEEVEFREAEGTQSQLNVYDDEDEVELDYSVVPRELRQADVDKNEVTADYRRRLAAIATQLAQMNPNLKAVSKLKEVQKQVKEMEKELKEARAEGQTVASKFHDIKKRRSELFMSAFSHVQHKIGEIYDALTRSSTDYSGGKAFLTVQDPDEPFNAGISYQAIPPSKRFFQYDQLSGGEKSVASLAFIFAVQSYKPSPFFILDEVDAALDAVNVEKVVNYISHASHDTQFIVISLKDAFFSRADGLVGVYKNAGMMSSRVLSIDLQNRNYE